MFKWTRVLVLALFVVAACHRGPSDTFSIDGTVLLTAARPANATPNPGIPDALRATGGLVLRADAIPPELEDCAYPARQAGSRVLVYWTADTSFGSAASALEKRHVSIRGRIVRPNDNKRECSLFAVNVTAS